MAKKDKSEKTLRQAIDEEESRARRVAEAVQCIKRFFKDKPYYKPYLKDNIECNIIPKEVLLCPTNINLVIDTQDINLAMMLASEEIAKKQRDNIPLTLSGEITNTLESELYLKIIHEFKSLEVPYDYQAGMLLLYLWIVEGIEF